MTYALTPVDEKRELAKAQLEAIRSGLSQAEDAINWMIENEGWAVLGFASFAEMWDSTDLTKLKLGKVARKQIVTAVKAADPTRSNRAIARSLGVDEGTVRRDLKPEAPAESSALDDLFSEPPPLAVEVEPTARTWEPSAAATAREGQPQPQESTAPRVVLSIVIEDKLTVDNLQEAYEKLRAACMNNGFLFDARTYRVTKWEK